MARVVSRLRDEAEDDARRIITLLIYSTPERGYIRTGALRDSIFAGAFQAGDDNWVITVGATGSNEREYALFNELGTLGGHRSFDEILAEASGTTGDLILLEFGQPSSGLEPRPWVIPSVVGVVKKAPPLVIQAVRRADATARASLV